MEVKALIFDMDGLMFDSEQRWLDSVHVVNKKYGYDISDQTIISCMGMREDKICQYLSSLFGAEFDARAFLDLTHKFMFAYIKKHGPGVKHGLKKLLKYLKKTNIKTAIATSSERARVDLYLKKSHISEKYFDYILCGDQITESKPSPQIYLKACEALNVAPEEAMALEDSANGIRSAAAAGCITIHIPDLKKHPDEILSLCYKVVPSLDKVIDLL